MILNLLLISLLSILLINNGSLISNIDILNNGFENEILIEVL
jgi:hypothetical protein